MDLLVDAISNAVLIVWAGISILLIVRLRVFSPALMGHAPERSGAISVPLTGAVIVLYFFFGMLLSLAALGLGYVKDADLKTQSPPPITIQTTTQHAQSHPAATSPAVTPSPAEKPTILYTIEALAETLTIATTVVAFAWLFKGRLRGWGLHPQQMLPGIKLGLLGYAIIFPMLVFAGYLCDWVYSWFGYKMVAHPALQTLSQHPAPLKEALIYVTAVLIAPIGEEIFFRGCLQTSLIQFGWGLLIPQFLPPQRVPLNYTPSRLQRWVAILLASALFAAMHPADEMPIIFLLALGLGYLYEVTGILWAPIVLHIAFNSTSLILNLLPQPN